MAQPRQQPMPNAGPSRDSSQLPRYSRSIVDEKADEPKQTTPAGHTIPVPTRGEFDQMVKTVAPPPAGRKRPDETDEPPAQSER